MSRMGTYLAAHESLLDFGARFYDPATAIFLQQDPLAEKYYNISPYAYCANNPVNFVDPDGMDWIKNSETGKYEWRDDINRDSEIPDGYRYVGSTTESILDDLNINTQYQSESSYVYSLVMDSFMSVFWIFGYYVDFTVFFAVETNISADKSRSNDNNMRGLSFDGVTFTATMLQKGDNLSNTLDTGVSAMLNMSYGRNQFSASIVNRPSNGYIVQSGDKLTCGSIFIPASMFAPHLAFGNAIVNASPSDFKTFGGSRELKWCIEKRMMYRPAK